MGELQYIFDRTYEISRGVKVDKLVSYIGVRGEELTPLAASV